MLSEDHAQWLEARGIDLEIATNFGLTTSARRRNGQAVSAIKIPYQRRGKIINHKYRLFGADTNWTQDAGAMPCFWNEDVLRDPTLASYPLVITEGEWDALISLQCGYARTVSPPNGAGMKLELADEIKPMLLKTKKIILGGDGDEAGRKLNAELARRLGAVRCFWLDYPEGCKDLNDVWQRLGPDAARALLDNARPYPVKGLFTLDTFPPEHEPEIFSTGFPSLNPYLKLFRGEMMVMTGVPSHGKSRFALELLASLNLQHQHRSVLASPEMRVIPYVRDVFREHHSGVKLADMSEQQKADADLWINGAFAFIDQDPRDECEDAHLDWFIDKASDAVFRYGVHWFLLDPWNQVEHKRSKYETPVDYQARAIRSLKRFARSYDCGVIVVAHPTKGVMGLNGKVRKPGPYDIDGSAHWFNAPDHCVTVWAEDPKSLIREIEVTKSRYRAAGWPGSAFLKLEGGRLQSTVKAF
jgi:twinkle protein